jgi:soluble lytic murein transglycosylase-like protein
MVAAIVAEAGRSNEYKRLHVIFIGLALARVVVFARTIGRAALPKGSEATSESRIAAIRLLADGNASPAIVTEKAAKPTASAQYLCFTQKTGDATMRRFVFMVGFAFTIVFASFANADCIDDAAIYFTLDPLLVRAIAQHESGMRSLAINRNANGSVDIGLMQINSGWLPTLVRAGIAPQSLWNPCVNAYVGAWILKSNIARFGPTWKAVGAYNAASPAKQLRYANQIHAQWESIRQRIHVTQRPWSNQNP